MENDIITRTLLHAEIVPSDPSKITNIVMDDIKVLELNKESGWIIEKLYTDYTGPGEKHCELAVVLRKE